MWCSQQYVKCNELPPHKELSKYVTWPVKLFSLPVWNSIFSLIHSHVRMQINLFLYWNTATYVCMWLTTCYPITILSRSIIHLMDPSIFNGPIHIKRVHGITTLSCTKVFTGSTLLSSAKEIKRMIIFLYCTKVLVPIYSKHIDTETI